MIISLYYTVTELVKSKNASFKVLVVVFLRIHIFWFVTLWHWMSGFQRVERTVGTTNPMMQGNIPEFSTV
jgi:hypothetical protein